MGQSPSEKECVTVRVSQARDWESSGPILQIKNLRDKTLAAGLLGGFLLNAAFNEVALSPNSAAPYFIILGLVIGSDLAAKEELDAVPALQLEGDTPSIRDLGREGPLRAKQA